MESVKSIINPKDGIEYFVGDRVCIYQGRFGHNNIMTIKSIWVSGEDIYVSENETLPGTYIQAIKYKISDKEFKKILKAKNLSWQYKDFNIIN